MGRIAWIAVAVVFGSTARAADDGSTPTATPTATAAPIPPRALRLRAGLAQFRPRQTAGKLEDAGKGVSVTVFAAESRIAPGLRVDVDLDYDTRSYSAAHVPHLTGFAPRATLDGFTAGIGLRVSPPLGDRPPLEPWIGASGRLVYTKLTPTYFGGATGGEPTDTAWTVGADLGAGLVLFLGAPWFVGVDVRWRVGRAHLAPLGDVDVGGLLVGASVGAALP